MEGGFRNRVTWTFKADRDAPVHRPLRAVDLEIGKLDFAHAFDYSVVGLLVLGDAYFSVSDQLGGRKQIQEMNGFTDGRSIECG